MTDRETLVNALANCLGKVKGTDLDTNPCGDCPYSERGACVYAMMDDALALLREQTQVVRCTGCKYWYRDSGLTARMCEKHGIITKQFDFCSYGEKVQNA